MESVNEIKEALSARSRTATLDELRSEGRKRVRLIRAEHVAAMIAEAVNAAVEQSGLLAPEEVERLVEKSRQEFRSILREREQEVQRAHDVEEKLEATTAELRQAQAELYRLRAQFDQPTPGARAATAAAPAAGGAPSTDLMMSLVQEMATLKANLMHQQAQDKAPAAASGGGADFSAAFEKLAGSLNDRLEKLGKKMGVSAAVESPESLDFGGLFRDADKALESNIDNIEVKQKAGGGIAANLARLKKLKGGG